MHTETFISYLCTHSSYLIIHHRPCHCKLVPSIQREGLNLRGGKVIERIRDLLKITSSRMLTKKNFMNSRWREDREEDSKLVSSLENLQIDTSKHPQPEDTTKPKDSRKLQHKEPESIRPLEDTRESQCIIKTDVLTEGTGELQSISKESTRKLENSNSASPYERPSCDWQPPSSRPKDRWLAKQQQKKSSLGSSPIAADSEEDPGTMTGLPESTAIFGHEGSSPKPLPGLAGEFGIPYDGSPQKVIPQQDPIVGHRTQQNARQINHEISIQNQMNGSSTHSRKDGNAELGSYYVHRGKQSQRRSNRLQHLPQPSEIKPHPTQELWDHLNSLVPQDNSSASLEFSPERSVRSTISPGPKVSGQSTPKTNIPARGTTQGKPPGRETPVPDSRYIDRARQPVNIAHEPQRLLVVLDLNGTLLERKRTLQNRWKRSSVITARPGLTDFLRYCLDNHSVMIWSSARPANVETMCNKIFSEQDLTKLVGMWGRDRLDLSSAEYNDKVQVYKRLEKVWTDKCIQSQHPEPTGVWSQMNTVLVDDSVLKGSSQPYNLIEVPEFEKKNWTEELEDMILARVMEYIELARRSVDVSAYMQKHSFRAGKVKSAETTPA